MKTLIHYGINCIKKMVNGHTDEAAIANAKRILALRLQRCQLNAVEDHSTVKDYLTMWFDQEDSQKLCCLFLDQEHHLIQSNNMLFGTIEQCEGDAMKAVARMALMCNASAIIFASNVSAIDAEKKQSSSVESLKTVQQVLELVNIRVVDYVLISGVTSLSFREKQLM